MQGAVFSGKNDFKKFLLLQGVECWGLTLYPWEDFVNNKRAIISAACLLGVVAVSTFWLYYLPKNASNRNLPDDALLALIKNDQKAFEEFISAGGNVHDSLPAIDGKTYTVAEGIAYFERTSFSKALRSKSVRYLKQDASKPYDIMTIAIKKNNPELLNELSIEKPDFALSYQNGWTMLHMAGAWCSHKLAPILHKTGHLRWDTMAKDGSTPLTLAAENECLPMLSYWKEQGADFRMKDAKGRSALSILKGKKDAALRAFAESFEERAIATITVTKTESAPVVPDFYKKRKIPKEQVVDHAAMLEPEDRPLESVETAKHSEFAD